MRCLLSAARGAAAATARLGARRLAINGVMALG
jgi:ABC-type transporter Mla maintaining outer membrane lipid asymmetry permease subunit MlaE